MSLTVLEHGAGYPPLAESIDWADPVNRESAQADGLYAWWPGTGSAGLRLLRDLSGWGRDVPLNGGAWVDQPELGPSPDYTGSVYADLGLSPQYYATTTTRFALTAWVRDTSLNTTDRRIFSFLRASGSTGIGLGKGTLNANSAKAYAAYRNSAGTYTELVSTTSINDGQPHHVAVVIDLPNIVLYVDGVAEASASNAHANTFAQSGSPLRADLGSFDHGLSNSWLGEIYEARVYLDTVPDAATLRAMFDRGTRWDLQRLLRRRLWQPPVVTPLLLSGRSAGIGHTFAAGRISRRGAGRSAGAGSASAGLRVTRRVRGASAGSAATTGSFTLARAWAGRTSGVGAPTAQATLRRRLAGQCSGVGRSSGTLYRPTRLSGQAAGLGTTQASFTLHRSLLGRSGGESASAATLFLRRQFAGYAAGVGRTTGRLNSAGRFGPPCYGGTVALLTAYGGSVALSVRYGGSLSIPVRYGGSVETCDHG